jgi:hypothetical protein
VSKILKADACHSRKEAPTVNYHKHVVIELILVDMAAKFGEVRKTNRLCEQQCQMQNKVSAAQNETAQRFSCFH